jgi:hypothetical protein
MQAPSVSLEVAHLFDRLCLHMNHSQVDVSRDRGLRLKGLRNENAQSH